MDMNCSIGIDVTATAVRLVQVARRRGRVSVLGTHTRLLDPDGLPADTDALRVLLLDVIREAGFKAHANRVIGLPHGKVFFHDFTTDLAPDEDVRRLLRFELEDDFPIPFDDMVVDLCGHRPTNDGRRTYLVAAATRRELDPWVRALATAGSKSCVLSTDVCALAAIARLAGVQEGTICGLVYADGSRMALSLVQDGSLVCARARHCSGDVDTIASALARDVELTLRASFRKGHQPPVRILLGGPDTLGQELSEKLSQATGREVQWLDASSMVQRPQASQSDGEFTVALGLALLGLDRPEGQMNFLHADLANVDRTARSRTKRAAIVSVVLLAAILGLLGLRTVRELRDLQREHARLNGEIRTIFLNALPGEKRIVNELAQMTEHLNTLRKRRDTLVAAVGEPIRPLWALQVLSETLASDQGIRISSFVVSEKAIRIAGTGDSFETVERFLEGLRRVPQFGSVELDDMTSSRGSDRPAFRLVISVRAG